jgi:hypothetical protein
VRLLRMVKDTAAVVAAASSSRGIGYLGDMVRFVTFHPHSVGAMRSIT